jgi:hypothetical protein
LSEPVSARRAPTFTLPSFQSRGLAARLNDTPAKRMSASVNFWLLLYQKLTIRNLLVKTLRNSEEIGK